MSPQSNKYPPTVVGNRSQMQQSVAPMGKRPDETTYGLECQSVWGRKAFAGVA